MTSLNSGPAEMVFEQYKHDPIMCSVVCFAASVICAGEEEIRQEMASLMKGLSDRALVLMEAQRILEGGSDAL